jgi:hypothetical protein
MDYRTSQGPGSENGHADQEQTSPPESIAKGTAKEQQDGIRQGVAVSNPLQAAAAGMQLLHQRRERDIEHGLIK